MRLFIGIDLPPHVKRSLSNSQLRLRKMGLDGGWKSSELFHITLEFLGERPFEAVPVLARILKSVTTDKRYFKLRIDGLGAFPSLTRPHTLWAGVGGNLERLEIVWKEMHEALQQNGFELEATSFIPHVTLLSHVKTMNIDLSAFSFGKTGGFAVHEITLFESKTEKGKCIYIPLYHARLSG